MEFISNKNNNIKAFSFIFVVLYFEYFFSRRGTRNHRFLSSAMSEVQSILSQRHVFGSDVVSYAPLYPPNLTARLKGGHFRRVFAGFRTSATKKKSISAV